MRSKIHISNDPLTSMSFNSDFEYLAIGGYNRLVSIVSAKSGKVLSQLKGHTYEVLSNKFNPNHSQIASGGKEKDIFIWDVLTGVFNKLKGHQSHILDLSYHDSNILLSSSLDSSVIIWDLRSNKVVQTLQDAQDSVLSVKSIDSEIFSASMDGNIRTYDLRNNKLITDNVSSSITDLDLFRTSRKLLSYSQDGCIRVIQRDNGKLTRIFQGKPYSNNSKCRLMCNDDKIVSGDEHGVVTIYNQDFTVYDEIKCHSSAVQSISCHDSDNCFATIGQDGCLNLHSRI
eukprot:NODE_677_length_5302_cov_0.446089.p2 type:complete len:286 gc:universal NODE_677_length_5302_cov_0.446089:4147-3290(-)